MDLIMAPRSIHEPGPLLSAQVADLLQRRKRKKPPGPNITALPPPVTPPPLKALRGGMRNSSEGCTGIHLRESSVRSMEHAASIRGKIRSVILILGASNDDDEDSGAQAEEEPLGTCDALDGIRWKRCRQVGIPLKEAWALAVAERMVDLWVKIGLGPNGEVRPYPPPEASGRAGLPGLPGCWCPHRPRSAARAPTRYKLRAFLGLLTEQKRVHIGELVAGYDAVARRFGVSFGDRGDVPIAQGGEGENLLVRHARYALKALKYEKRANARWEILLDKQCAAEAEEECDPAAVATRAPTRSARRTVRSGQSVRRSQEGPLRRACDRSRPRSARRRSSSRRAAAPRIAPAAPPRAGSGVQECCPPRLLPTV